MPLPVEITSPATVCLPVTLQPSAIEQCEAAVQRALCGGSRQLLLDCSDLRQLYSGHIKLLWAARELCLQHGASLRLLSVRPDIIRVLTLLDLLEFFPFKVSDRNQGYADAISPSHNVVREALVGFSAFLKHIEAPWTVVTDANTIFYEIVTNIINHGCLDPAEMIIVTAILYSVDSTRELVVKFTDTGIPFDPSQPKSQLAPKNAATLGQTRGFGLMMIERLVDSIAYERHRSTFNVLTVKKRWSI